MQEAGDTEADHHGGIAREDRELVLGVDASPQDLKQRSIVGRDRIGKRMQKRLGDCEVLGEDSVEIAAQQTTVEAEIGPVGPAQMAVTAGDTRIDHDPGARREQTHRPGGLDHPTISCPMIRG